MRMYFRPLEFDNCHQVTKQTNFDFMFLIQCAALFGLKEAGQLSEIQHRQAEAALLEQKREYIREHTRLHKDD